ncbi:hypothetical protein [Nitratiruptor sp. YY09-18]|uniref:hypothetical protein n=1 Tax=Nitratiruptor sp. YY09-18 TaxID=2724901 RepID=UPI0019164EA6|nr:hypothetical protein [Nitratiruptor sp. YY09-18]BCD68691.1 hypothetical protein NitYY0918_C1608 [Nitratiruptor sp. YY09-18]
MRLYFYAKTDNRLGLDRLRRTVALMHEFKDIETYLMTTEFRSATYAKRILGIQKAVGIEDFRNIGNICERGDVIIYDSDEHNEIIHQEMIDYFGAFFRISYDPKDAPKEGEYLINPYIVGHNVINAVLVDSRYFGEFTKEKRLFFYGDSDYHKEMLQIAPKLIDFDFDLLEGFYFFVDMEEKLKRYFKNIYAYDEYIEILQESKIFVSGSAQSALEAAATGARVIYFGDDEEYVQALENVKVRNIGIFDAAKLQEALLDIPQPHRDYLLKLSAEQAAYKIMEILKSNS